MGLQLPGNGRANLGKDPWSADVGGGLEQL